MPNVTKIQVKKEKFLVRKRVAAYARVSMETERLHHSLSAQVSHYSAMIQSNPEWEYAGVYADEGVTGTIAAKRPEFSRLLADCEAGKIDLVITKSISRFARNTVDLLNTVRRLKEIGVEVRFEKEGISTFDGTGEVMLTLLASFAQEEITSLSSNVKWGIRKRFAKGEPCTHFRVYGYRWEGDSMVIVPEEAAVVRRIFQNFLDGKSRLETEREFAAEGITTAKGCRWVDSNIKAVLTNVTYTGNLLLQKEFIADPVSKQKKKNRGELPQYWIENHHKPIISLDTFQYVQGEIARRKELGPLANKSLNTSCFTGRIKCGSCGASFMRGSRRNNAKAFSLYPAGSYALWSCGTRRKKGMKCPMKAIPEAILRRACAEALGLAEFSDKIFAEKVERINVIGNGLLEFIFKDGMVRRHEWKSTAKKDVWTDDYKERQREWVKAYQIKEGGRFHPFTRRICSESGAPFRRANGGYVKYWRREGIGIREDVLKEISADVLGLDAFDEHAFRERVSSIIVSKEKLLTFHLADGGIAVRQYSYKPKPTIWTDERRARFSELAKEWNTPERRKMMSEKMKEIRRTKKWPQK